MKLLLASIAILMSGLDVIWFLAIFSYGLLDLTTLNF